MAPENFNQHPAQTNDFWRRWHISLPLGCAITFISRCLVWRKVENSSYVNLSITMVACGLWHGLGWTYALWTVPRAVPAAHHARRRWKPVRLVMQQLVVIGWILSGPIAFDLPFIRKPDARSSRRIQPRRTAGGGVIGHRCLSTWPRRRFP
jgi:D-alanyl-lipoteichoic acid acyltransferase DltB (MBOAT superfamily)